jgi:hypothetical protein
VALALVGDVNACCDHLAQDEGVAWCDINRKFPFECICAAWINDADPTPDRERLWNYHVVGPKQEQAEVATADPIPSS